MERRYSDEEIQGILARAAEAEGAREGQAGGLTLAEIQSAAAKAGISAESIAVAATVHDRVGVAPREPSVLGIPLAVDRAVPLPRPLGDAEWRRLAAELRQTFDAEGRERVDGERREWRNGNLRIVHEPTDEGAFLELRTHKRQTRGFLVLSGTAAVASGALAGLHFLLGVGDLGFGPAAAGAVGLALFAASARQATGWARRRAQQFESLGAFARRLTGE